MQWPGAGVTDGIVEGCAVTAEDEFPAVRAGWPLSGADAPV